MPSQQVWLYQGSWRDTQLVMMYHHTRVGYKSLSDLEDIQTNISCDSDFEHSDPVFWLDKCCFLVLMIHH